jgi:hypothetical protein
MRSARIDADEWETLVTWVDANAPYHDTFYDKRPPGGGEPVRTHGLEPFPEFPCLAPAQD